MRDLICAILPNVIKMSRFDAQIWRFFRFFKMAAVHHLRIWKIVLLNVLWHKECQWTSSCQISSKSVKRLLRYRNITVFQNGGRHNLALSTIKFLTADMLKMPNLHDPAKFYQDRSIRCWGMAIFRFFKVVAIRHFGY